MKIQARTADAFARAPTVSCVLVYGPDAGLVAERGRTLRESVLGPGPPDPFRYAEPAPASIETGAGALVDEASALSLAGGRRVVRVVSAGDALAGAFAALLEARAGGDAAAHSLVIAEAGNLGPRSRLRQLFEASQVAAALPCYVDDADRLAGFAASVLRDLGHGAEPAVLDWIAAALGGDRAVLRRELEKLSLYAGPGATIRAADAMACLGDSADVGLAEAASAAAQGDVAGLDCALGRCTLAGHAPVAILRALGRHLGRVHLAVGVVAGGGSEKSALAALRPPVFFKEEPGFRLAMGLWSPGGLERALEILNEAEEACKRVDVPDQAVAWRAALRIAHAAQRSA